MVSLPVICGQENFFLRSDDHVAVMPHDVWNKGNNGERHSCRRSQQVRRDETRKGISLYCWKKGNVHLISSAPVLLDHCGRTFQNSSLTTTPSSFSSLNFHPALRLKTPPSAFQRFSSARVSPLMTLCFTLNRRINRDIGFGLGKTFLIARPAESDGWAMRWVERSLGGGMARSEEGPAAKGETKAG